MPFNLNAGQVLGAGAAGRPYFQRFGRNVDTNLRYASSDSEYNALQMKFDKRYTNGFLLTTAYTWARAMANAGDDNGGPMFYINPERNWARAGFDRRHTFVQSYIYELPFGKGKQWLSSGVVSHVLGGWQVNGILTLMTGNAINFSSNAATNAPGNGQTPNINGPFRILGGINDTPRFDTGVFSAPAPNTFGNVGRNAASGPSFKNLDASLFKQFRISERMQFEFRAEAFSVTNSPRWQLNNPNVNVNDSNFGLIRGAGGNRAMQLGAKLSF